MILVIDNYDSFVYNLVQYVGELGKEPVVFRNDKIMIDNIKELNPEAIIISPGPSIPEKAGISLEIIKKLKGKIPILGVCLGHQAIAMVFGAKIDFADKIYHGKISRIYHDGKTIYKGMKNPFQATRYHSLIVKRDGFPGCLEITAETEDKTIMGIRHKKYKIEGVQFHPESILTFEGKQIIKNFLSLI
jgi:anthranilate synthase/aminodeoxychorismate synthase-like glutamine amidotransferase